MMTTIPTAGVLARANAVYQLGSSNLPKLAYQTIVNKSIEALQKCYSSSSLPCSSHLPLRGEAIFFGVDWTALRKELADLGFIKSIPKILKVFYDITMRFQEVFTSPLVIENLMPGTIRFVYTSLIKFEELKKELVTQQARLHQAKVKYLVASQELPFTLETCRQVFEQAYNSDREYQVLCEESFKEIYNPYTLDLKYRITLFALSYAEKIYDFIPILKLCGPTKEKEIEKSEQEGDLSTQFSDVDFFQLSGSEVIDLFKKKLNIPHTLALTQQTIEYEKKLHCYHQLVLDDETTFTELCLRIAGIISRRMYKEVWKKHMYQYFSLNQKKNHFFDAI